MAQRAEPGTRVARRHPDRPAEKQRHAGSAPAALRRRPFACRKVRLQRGHAPVQDVPYAREGGAQQRLHAAPPARVPERNERQHLRGERAHPVRGERPFVRARPAREGPHRRAARPVQDVRRRFVSEGRQGLRPPSHLAILDLFAVQRAHLRTKKGPKTTPPS